MSLAVMVRRMSEAGAPPEAIAIALEEIEALQTALESRRAADRDRKRSQRERQKSADVTGHSRDSHGTVTGQSRDTPPPTLDKEKSPQTPLKEINSTPPAPTHETRAREANPFPRPGWADPQVWSDLLANRRRKGLANTVSAHRKLLTDIDKLVDENWPPGRVLEAAVSRGWGAIYAGCKDDDDGRSTRTQRMAGNHGSSVSGRGRTIDAAMRFVARGGPN